jgi:hypothetical protein
MGDSRNVVNKKIATAEKASCGQWVGWVERSENHRARPGHFERFLSMPRARPRFAYNKRLTRSLTPLQTRQCAAGRAQCGRHRNGGPCAILETAPFMGDSRNVVNRKIATAPKASRLQTAGWIHSKPNLQPRLPRRGFGANQTAPFEVAVAECCPRINVDGFLESSPHSARAHCCSRQDRRCGSNLSARCTCLQSSAATSCLTQVRKACT